MSFFFIKIVSRLQVIYIYRKARISNPGFIKPLYKLPFGESILATCLYISLPSMSIESGHIDTTNSLGHVHYNPDIFTQKFCDLKLQQPFEN